MSTSEERKRLLDRQQAERRAEREQQKKNAAEFARLGKLARSRGK